MVNRDGKDKSPAHGTRRGRLRYAVLLAALIPVACSGGGSGAAAAGSGGTQAPRPAAQLPQAADFEIVVYQGGAELGSDERVAFSDVLGGGKPVILNFWAGLCPPCRAEMPEFQEVYEAFGDQIVLVGIDLGPFTGLGTIEQGKALLQELAVTYPAGTTEDASVVSRYQVLGMPSTFFVTPGGGITRKWTGLLTRAKLAEFTDELLAASGD